jgi:uncharacterized protein
MNKLKTSVSETGSLSSTHDGMSLIEQVKTDLELTHYMELADKHLAVAGYTEHGIRHGSRVGKSGAAVLRELGCSNEDCELAEVAGYLHDIGNFICRTNHGQTAAAMLHPILRRLGFGDLQTGLVLSAIGNHEEQYGQVYNNICAAVVIGDKSDVHRSRVRHFDPAKNDIHDNVNYAVTESRLVVKPEQHEIDLVLTIDGSIATVMDYFEIFITRMAMCRAAAQFLGCSFRIIGNGTVLS